MDVVEREAGLDALVAQSDAWAVRVVDRSIRRTGLPPPPWAVMFLAISQPCLMGQVRLRDCRRGTPDAVTAVVGLGLLPSVLAGSRLLVVWDGSLLRLTLGESAGRECRHGLWVLDARLDGHTVRHRRFTVAVTDRPDGTRSCRPRWEPATVHPDHPLPGPVEGALGLWRQQRRGDVEAARARVQAEGYPVTWLPDLAQLTDPGEINAWLIEHADALPGS
jgi:hypothetical protein